MNHFQTHCKTVIFKTIVIESYVVQIDVFDIHTNDFINETIKFWINKYDYFLTYLSICVLSKNSSIYQYQIIIKLYKVGTNITVEISLFKNSLDQKWGGRIYVERYEVSVKSTSKCIWFKSNK